MNARGLYQKTMMLAGVVAAALFVVACSGGGSADTGSAATTTTDPTKTATAAATTTATVAPTATPTAAPTVAATAAATEEATAAASADDELLALGSEIFNKTAGGVGCAFCHGADGKGDGPAMVGAPPNRGANEQLVREKLGSVPDMSGIKLTDHEIDAVVAYLAYLDTQP